MLQGKYCDVVTDETGKVLLSSKWESNCIVDTAWPLISGLLKNDPAVLGISYWAVGSGLPEWTVNSQVAECTTKNLQSEVLRVPVDKESIFYLNPDGSSSEQVSSYIEVNSSFTWEDEPVTLREFGIFGGNATESPDSGYLINYVIHPAIQLTNGRSLTRKMRFSFLAMGGGINWLYLPEDGISGLPVNSLEGVGDNFTKQLSLNGIYTLGELANFEPTEVNTDLPIMLVIHWRTLARHLIKTTAELTTISELSSWRIFDLVTMPIIDLKNKLGVLTEERILITREQLRVLVLGLDDSLILKMTYNDLINI